MHASSRHPTPDPAPTDADGGGREAASAVEASPARADAGEPPSAAGASRVHALLASAVDAYTEPTEEDRWPPGVGLVFAVAVCGGFWWAVIAAVSRA